MNQAKFTYDINPLWGDLDNVMEQIDNSTINNCEMMTDKEINKNHSEDYDLQTNLQWLSQINSKKPINISFQAIEHPFLLENQEYYKLIRVLNKEQQEIVKDIAIKNVKNYTRRFTCSLPVG